MLIMPNVHEESRSVTKAGVERLETNMFKQQGLSNSQAKRAAENAEVTQEILDAAQFALSNGLNHSQAVAFIAMQGEAEEKLKILKNKIIAENVASQQLDARKSFAKDEFLRKSKRIQQNGVRGTDKQVEWALQIRDKVIIQHGGKTYAQKTAFEELTKRIKSAKWWIENRNLQLKQPFTSIGVEDFIKNQLGLSDGEF